MNKEKFNELLSEYLKENYLKYEPRKIISNQEEDHILYDRLPHSIFNSAALDGLIKSNYVDTDSWKEIAKIVDSKGMKDSDLYNKAGIDRRKFSKFRNGETKLTKKEYMAMAIALELSIEETEKILSYAGFAFSNNSYFDLVVKFCIQNGNYNFDDINTHLAEYDCKKYFL